MKDAVYSGPVFDRAERSGSGLLISFRHAEGLHTLDGKAPLCFEIAGADKKFVPAAAVVEGERVRLSAPGVLRPEYARYAWSATNPGVNLVSGAGLPLFPFDSSDPFFQEEKHRRMNR
jgi:sialate O-acetylesterase